MASPDLPPLAAQPRTEIPRFGAGGESAFPPSFLYHGNDGWRLCPAYDLNPVPTDIKPRVLTLAINEEDTTASLAIAMEVAGYFDLEEAQAREIAVQVARATSRWRDEAATQGIAKAEIDRMSSAFEHEDLSQALRKNIQ